MLTGGQMASNKWKTTAGIITSGQNFDEMPHSMLCGPLLGLNDLG